tara:strand:+ start:22756 stop:23220 length:465 start_codon:yes stop_codon:yes gene_type:complete
MDNLIIEKIGDYITSKNKGYTVQIKRTVFLALNNGLSNTVTFNLGSCIITDLEEVFTFALESYEYFNSDEFKSPNFMSNVYDLKKPSLLENFKSHSQFSKLLSYQMFKSNHPNIHLYQIKHSLIITKLENFIKANELSQNCKDKSNIETFINSN